MNLSYFKTSKTIRQVAILFASNILLIGIGFGIKKIQTQQLGEINYGEYAFFISLVTFLSLFFRFGFFVSLQNLLAQNHNEIRKKKLLAIGFTMALINGIALSVIVWLLSHFVNDIFKTNIGATMQLLAPLTVIFPFYYLFNSYGTGTNKLKINAYYNVLPKMLFLILLLFYLNKLNIINIIFFNLISTLTIIIYFFLKIKPNFSNFKKYWNILWLKNKKYGFHYYQGAIANQTTYKLDELFISYFKNTTLLGFYSLALLVASPMILMSQAISQSMFKQYSKLKKIPKKIFLYNTLWLLLCIVFFYFFADLIVDFLFGESFKSVGKYILYISFALFFQGLTSPYSFLAAKSKGKEIRNVAWAEAFVNITGNIILIPILGVEGAIITSILSKFTNYIFFKYYYKQYLKELYG